MIKKFFCYFIALNIIFGFNFIYAKGYEDFLYKKYHEEFNTVDGYEKLQDISRFARDEYIKGEFSAKNYLLGKLRYGIYLSDNLKDNIDAKSIIKYVLNAKVDKYKNKTSDNIISNDRIDKLFKDGDYNYLNKKDILTAFYRLSFGVGNNHDAIKTDNKVNLDKIIDDSIKNETYPVLFGNFENISYFCGRCGYGMFPIMYYNYFINDKNNMFVEAEDFSSQVGSFISPEDINKLCFISVDDAYRIINNTEFISIK